MDIMELIIYYLSGSVQWQTTFYYEDTTGATVTSPQDLWTTWVANVSPSLLACLNTNTKIGCGQVKTKAGTNIPNTVFQVDFDGTGAGEALPATNIQLITRYADTTRKGIHKNFFSGLGVANVDKGMIDDTQMGLLQTFATAMNSNIGPTGDHQPRLLTALGTWVAPVRTNIQPRVACLRSRTSNPCTVTA